MKKILLAATMAALMVGLPAEQVQPKKKKKARPIQASTKEKPDPQPDSRQVRRARERAYFKRVKS